MNLRLGRTRIVSIGLLLSVVLAGDARAQVTFEQVVLRLSHKDADERLRAVQALKASAYPEAAVPLAAAIVDSEDDVQVEAIAAALNIFLAKKVVPKKRVAFLVEMRERVAAEPTFSAGPSALGPLRVPLVLATSLTSASRDDHPRVALEAVYAFGALAGEVAASDRATVLAQAAPVLAGLIGAPDPALRAAALRVTGHVFERRADDGPIDQLLGDALISALNDREAAIREIAMWALGSTRYDRSVQGLTELFHHYRRGPLAAAALDALAHIGHPATLPDLVAQLASKTPALRLIAIEGLARSGDRSRAEGVRLALTSERNEALLLAGHFANVMLADGAVDAIVEALRRPKLREQARQYIRQSIGGRLAAFGRYLQDPDRQVRIDVVEALAYSHDPGAAALIYPLTQDEDPEVARVATRALARLGRGAATF